MLRSFVSTQFSGLKTIDFIMIGVAVTGLNIYHFIEAILIHFNIQSQPQPIPILSRLSVTLISILIMMFFFGRRTKSQSEHSFEAGTQEEADYFCNWYKENGKLTIFCRDLYWLDRPEFLKVKHVLTRKAVDAQLDLYVKDSNHPFFRRLTQISKGKVCKVKESVESEHRFSIREEGELKPIIIRNVESSGNDVVKFTAYKHNPILVKLAKDMLGDICEPASINTTS